MASRSPEHVVECEVLCECANCCLEHIPVTLDEYETVRLVAADLFVLPGHEVRGLDLVIEKNDRYTVVSRALTMPVMGSSSPAPPMTSQWRSALSLRPSPLYPRRRPGAHRRVSGDRLFVNVSHVPQERRRVAPHTPATALIPDRSDGRPETCATPTISRERIVALTEPV